MNSPSYKLLDWIPIDFINWTGMSINPNGEELLRKNYKFINYFNLAFRNDYFSYELLTLNKNIVKSVQLFYLSKNPFAVNYLMKNIDLICWYYLSYNSNPKILELFKNDNYKDKIIWTNLSSNTNPEILEFLFEHPDKINWCQLSSNECDYAIQYLKKNQKEINWLNLSKNSNDNAIDLLLENKDKIIWYNLSMNTNDRAIDLLFTRPELINMYSIVYNTNNKAMKFLKKNKNKITNWSGLCYNENDIAIDLILENPEKIDFINLCYNKNPRILNILKENIDRICWYTFSSNPLIFKLDYQKMSDKFINLKEDLIKEVMHPLRVFKNPDYDYIEELFDY